MVNRSLELQSEAWIDRYTRAIFIEFTVYNVGTNLFSINTMLLEMPDSSSIHPIWRYVHPSIRVSIKISSLEEYMAELACDWTLSDDIITGVELNENTADPE